MKGWRLIKRQSGGLATERSCGIVFRGMPGIGGLKTRFGFG
jgi:hypothetical protein